MTTDITSNTTQYDSIATHFSKTRYKIWHGVRNFLNSIKEGSMILDAGCGNGKNMLETNHIFYGFDISDELLVIAKNKTEDKKNVIEIKKGSITSIAYPSHMFDAIISIAVIHHLDSYNYRVNAIKELIRVCKPSGKIMLSVWQVEDNIIYDKGLPYDNSSDTHDKLIPWKDTSGRIIANRYYHFFTFDEINTIMKNILC